jgi:hypothetical protein
MFTWEGFRNLTGSLSPTVVPTVALQNGVFNTATSPITDPLGICNIQPYTGQTVNGQQFGPGGYYISNLYGPSANIQHPTATCGDPTMKIIKTFYPGAEHKPFGGRKQLAADDIVGQHTEPVQRACRLHT